MASKRATDSRASKAKAAPRAAVAKRQAPTAAQLHQVIERLIDAKHNGDYDAGNQAAADLAAISKHAAASRVQRFAAEAQAVAQNADMKHSLMHLQSIAARLKGNL